MIISKILLKHKTIWQTKILISITYPPSNQLYSILDTQLINQIDTFSKIYTFSFLYNK